MNTSRSHSYRVLIYRLSPMSWGAGDRGKSRKPWLFGLLWLLYHGVWSTIFRDCSRQLVEWRGPHGNGFVSDQAFPTKWSESDHVAWKVPIPGRGASTPVVVKNLIVLTAG